MRVGLVSDDFDVERGSGIARYSSELFSGLIREKIKIELISTRRPAIPYGMTLSHSLILPAKVFSIKGRFDILHATAPILGINFPFIDLPKVVTFHDLSSILCDNKGIGSHAALSLPFLFKIVAKQSDKVIAVSQQTKDELITNFGIPNGKIAVINQGIDERFISKEKKTKKNGFIIGYVGTMAPRKRLDLSIRTIYYLLKGHKDLNIKFYIYGAKQQDYPKLLELVNDLGVSKYVGFKGFVPDIDLVDVYNSFDILLMSSQWEGFCMPILEAQRCGVPVIIRDDGHIPKEVSKCCLAAKSENDMAELTYNLLTDGSLRKKTISAGIDYSKSFTWKSHINKTIRVYEEALNK